MQNGDNMYKITWTYTENKSEEIVDLATLKSKIDGFGSQGAMLKWIIPNKQAQIIYYDEVVGTVEYMNTVKEFHPCVSYNADGDCIEGFITNDDYVAEWINKSLTLYKNRETGEIVGFLIENATHLMKKE